MSSDSKNGSKPAPGLRPGGPGGPGGPGRLRHVEKAKDARSALLRLLPYLRPYTLPLTLAFTFVLLYTLLQLAGPYLMGVAIDTFIIDADIPGLVRISLWMLLVYLFDTAF
ncbi:MAG: hypothetical protein JW862_05545, partial [Anaerolineales bacterium]|nr:hypothetical protein [Anaerolineales bacterium]